MEGDQGEQGGVGTGGVGQLDANMLNDFVLETAKKPLYTIHPRVHNRTATMWRGAITVQTENTLPIAFKTLIDENVLGAPVVTGSSNKFYGYIDLMDLVCYTITLFPPTMNPIKDSISDFFRKEEKFNQTTVREVIEFMKPGYTLRRDKMAETIPKSHSLLHALEYIVRTGASRAALVNDHEQVDGIISQSMLVGWIYNHLDSNVKAISQVPVIQFARSSVVTIDENQPAINAFKIMAETKISGLAIVNKSGELVDAVSVRDLRGMAPSADQFLRLWHPLKDFKREIRVLYSTKTPMWTDLFLLPSDTFRKAITMFDEERVHRLFIVRSSTDRVPTHMVTQRDLLNFVTQLAFGTPRTT